MKESLHLGIVMDPIHTIHPEKDTSFALLLEAQRRDWKISYLELKDLYMKYGTAWGSHRSLQVFDEMHHFFELGEKREGPLDQFDVILMRKDPPVDTEYLYATYMLEQAELNGTLVVNKPQALRNINEKLYTSWFPQCMPPTLIAASKEKLRAFVKEQGTAVLKPLGEMGGRQVFKCLATDPNLNVIIETLSHYGQYYVAAQRFIPEIEAGDKRVILIDGEPLPYALARLPASDDFRGNLAAGGTGIGVELSDRDAWISAQVGPRLKEQGILLAGLDIIGDYLTEINVTSPTCIRELEAAFDIDICGKILDTIEEKLSR